MIKNKVLILAMLIVAIVAVGSVSAADDVAVDIDEPADDIAVDEIAIEDDSADETDEIVETEQTRTITYTPYYIDTTSDFDGINYNITNGIFDGYEFIFDNTNDYTNFSMVTGNNNKFTGNGATIIGSTDNLFTVAGSNNIVITGFNMNVATGKAAIYGANVFNAEITNNNITGGKDGINIMQTHDNITISGNTITNFTRDGISLVDHRNLSDDDWTNRGNSVISNNVITGISIASTEVGMFFGGNFKGIISGNTITNVAEGIEFTGKKDKTNGRLYVEFTNNNISNIDIGLYMNNHNVTYFNISNSNIGLNSPNISYAIYAPANYQATGFIGVYNSNFNGTISNRFVTSVGNNYSNVTGFP